MLPSRASQAKAAIKGRLPVVATAYRALRRVPGLRPGGDRRRLTGFIRQQTGSRVATGPFAGMRLVDGSSWGDGDLAPKLLGTYEQELHDTIMPWLGRPYDAVVDVGCAEGYYAVGLARLFSHLTVHAFDTDAAALAVARRAAQANDVADRVCFAGFFDWQGLSALLERHPRLLIISDCEGYEADLFLNGDRRRLGRSDLIIECHERIRPGSTEALSQGLSGTHRVTRLDAVGRNPNQFPFLTDLHETDRWLAISENRPYCSHWLVCEHREDKEPDDAR